MAIQQINLGTAPTGVGGDTNRSAYTKINQNFTDSANAASRQVGTTPGNVMEVGAFGLGGDATNILAGDLALRKCQFVRLDEYDLFGIAVSINDSWGTLFGASNSGRFLWKTSPTQGKYSAEVIEARSTKNTTVDPNGFIKNASPIVSLYADKIELNAEAKLQPITLEKLGVGDYLIKGSTGFAQAGWYIETPKDANGNVLVAVVYEQLANNDISVKTYDYMLNKKGRIVPDLETPLDIPETRWIDLRLQALPQTTPLSKDETVNTNAE